MSDTNWGHRWSNGLHRQVWRIIVPIMRVPQNPPDLPGKDNEQVETFQPDEGFLGYMKFWFWILALVVAIGLLLVWGIIVVANIWVGLALTPMLVILIFIPDIVALIAIQLRYDTTWYAMTDRAIRLRRGIWAIHEVTISFENVQNVKVQQGPVQRHFGIANLTIETAGSGGNQQGNGLAGVSNQGVIEGVADANRIRDIILKRMRSTSFTGLGDDEHTPVTATPSLGSWSPQHIATLREIRDLIVPENAA